MRRFLIPIAILAVIVILADTGLRAFAEHQAASELREGLSLSATPSVGIGGWPFTVHLVTGSFPTVEVSGKDVTIEGLAVSDFDLALHDVDFSVGKLLSGKKRSIKVKSGSGSLSLSSDLVSERLGDQGLLFEFSIDGDQAILTSPEFGSVTVDVALEGRSLTMEPPGTGPVSIELPRIADQIEYESVEISDDAVRATFRLGAGRIDLSRG
jgi:hypothetical protein